MTKRPSQGVLFNLAAAGLIGLGLLIIAFTVWYVIHVRNSAYNLVTKGSSDRASLKVESEPAGIDVTGQPQCDSKKVGKTTPYECSAGAGFTTVLTAPSSIVSSGQTLYFKTWDGCAEANTDKKICKVKVGLGKVVTAKAGYEKLSMPNSSSQPIKPPAPNCDTADTNHDNFVDCKVTFFGAGQYVIDFKYVTKDGQQYNMTISPNYLTYCETKSDCDLTNTNGSLVSEVKKATNLYIQVPYKGNVSYLNQTSVLAMFDKWRTSYDQANNRFFLYVTYVPAN